MKIRVRSRSIVKLPTGQGCHKRAQLGVARYSSAMENFRASPAADSSPVEPGTRSDQTACRSATAPCNFSEAPSGSTTSRTAASSKRDVLGTCFTRLSGILAAKTAGKNSTKIVKKRIFQNEHLSVLI